jgi:hypothetical protein
MTFEQCKTALSEIRSRQGTDHPLVQITCSGSIVCGRLTRTDTDRPPHANQSSPYGLLVLEQPGLVPGPLTFVQIASIPENGLKEDITSKHISERARAGASAAHQHR